MWNGEGEREWYAIRRAGRWKLALLMLVPLGGSVMFLYRLPDIFDPNLRFAPEESILLYLLHPALRGILFLLFAVGALLGSGFSIASAFVDEVTALTRQGVVQRTILGTRWLAWDQVTTIEISRWVFRGRSSIWLSVFTPQTQFQRLFSSRHQIHVCLDGGTLRPDRVAYVLDRLRPDLRSRVVRTRRNMLWRTLLELEIGPGEML